MTDMVTETRDGGVLTLCMTQPPVNALSLPMIAALKAAFDRALNDPEIRVIVLGALSKVFCAGHDLREIRTLRNAPDGGRAGLQVLFDRCAELMQGIATSPKPVIARVDGLATAAGAQMVGAATLAFASDRATFCLPGVNNGGFCSTPLVSVGRSMARKHALEMALSGETLDAETAARFGLVNRVYPAEGLSAAVDAFSRKLAGRRPAAIARGLRVFDRQLALPLDQAYALAGTEMIDRFMTRDSDEGIDAFFERRPPAWTED